MPVVAGRVNPLSEAETRTITAPQIAAGTHVTCKRTENSVDVVPSDCIKSNTA